MAENTIIHEISLAGYKATSTGGMLDLGTWGSYGIEKLHLTLDAAWQDLTITAFFNVKGEVVAKKVVRKDGYADVPWEATKENTFAGRIVFEGSMNNQRRISANLNFKVTNHSEFEDSDPVPTDDRWNQFVTQNKEYRDGAFEAAERANARAQRTQRRPAMMRRLRQGLRRPARMQRRRVQAMLRRRLPRPGRMQRPRRLPKKRRKMRLLPRRPVRAQRTRWRRRPSGLPRRRRIPIQRPTMRPTLPERMLQLHSRRRRMRLLPLTMRARAPATPRPVRRRRRLPHRLRRRHRLLRLLPGTMR